MDPDRPDLSTTGRRLAPLLALWWSLVGGAGCNGTLTGELPPGDDDSIGDDDSVGDDDGAPGAPLEHVGAAGSAAPMFSIDRGFYDQPFDVEISSELDGAAVLYTLDGSDPRTSADAVEATSPASVHVDPYSDEGRDPAPGVVLRAALRWQGTLGYPVTHTYLFIGDAAALSPDDTPPGPGWPGIYDTGYNLDPRQAINYGLDPRVVEDPAYAELIDDAFLAIPTLSLATELPNLFDTDTGIYVNALGHGMDWERPVSVELLDPSDDGAHGDEFQANGGLRIRGGWSRYSHNPKHAFRLFFRGDYGPTKLEFPLFGDEGVDSFDCVDLRTSQNYSWSFKTTTGSANTMNRDVFSRDLQREMGRPYTRSRYYHLYLNGVYWGLYQTQERPEASFAESYLGGQKEDYDVVKVNGDEPTARVIEATDGNLDAWERVWELCEQGFASDENYYRLQGLTPDGSEDPHGETLVDIDNLIDYMLVIFFAGNFDSPTGSFTGNKGPNNFFAIRDRESGDEGFVFFAHDAEHALHAQAWSPGIGVYENRVNIGDIDGNYRMVVTEFENFHPQWLHHRLTEHQEYRDRFDERVRLHLLADGPATPDAAAALFSARAAEIELAIIAESARWGDSKSFVEHDGRTYRTRDDDWIPAVADTVDHFFLGLGDDPTRTEIVLGQLAAAGLYQPEVAP